MASAVTTSRKRRFRTLNTRNFDDRVDELFMKNHIAGEDRAAYSGFMFETYGPELEFVQKIAQENPDRVATIVDGGRCGYLYPGFCFVNRIGYMVFREDVTIPDWHEVRL